MKTTTKEPTKRERAIISLMSREGATKEEFKSLVIIRYFAGVPVCAIFSRGFKPLYHYKYRTVEQMETFITKEKEREEKEQARNDERLKEYDQQKEGFQVGSILVSSWGYEQTNIDWYIVIDRKNNFVTLQQIGSKRESEGGQFDDRGKCVADPSKIIGEPFKKQISKYASINLNSYSYCSLWDGRPKYWSSYA